MWYEIWAFGAEDWSGTGAGGWSLVIRTNSSVEAEQMLGELRKEYEANCLDWNW